MGINKMNGKVMKYVCFMVILFLVACEDHSKDLDDQRTPAMSNAKQYKDGLIGWWKFDEGKGETTLDATGNGNTASIVNGGWGEGRQGSALKMTGNNDGIVTIPLSTSLRTTAREITLMAWSYRTSRHNVDVIGHTYPYLFFGYHGSQFKFQVGTEKGKIGKCYADKKYRAALNTWHHLAGTYDGSKVRLYVDGKLICATSVSGLIVMPDEPFTISGYLDNKGKIVDEITGKIDDVRIYNRALSEDEIAKIMNSAN